MDTDGIIRTSADALSKVTYSHHLMLRILSGGFSLDDAIASNIYE